MFKHTHTPRSNDFTFFAIWCMKFPLDFFYFNKFPMKQLKQQKFHLFIVFEQLFLDHFSFRKVRQFLKYSPTIIRFEWLGEHFFTFFYKPNKKTHNWNNVFEFVWWFWQLVDFESEIISKGHFDLQMEFRSRDCNF